MVGESSKTANIVIAERNFCLICKGIFFLCEGPNPTLSFSKTRFTQVLNE